MNKISNPCSRCGKQRVVVEVKKELINGSMITTTTTTCPDKHCQELLDRQMEREKDARARLINLHKKPGNSFGRQSGKLSVKKVGSS